MRVVHLTDIHYFSPPTWRDAAIKRVAGTANLYLRGRRRAFSPAAQRAAVQKCLDLQPDAVVITGDLTSQALRAEFQMAREALDPVLSAFPTLVLWGNHDAYTPNAVGERRLDQYFSSWMGEAFGAIRRLRVGDLTVLSLNPCRPTWLSASGELPQEQLDSLSEALSHPGSPGESTIIALHYPVVDRAGRPYTKPGHGLLNAQALIEVLRGAPRTPAVVLHGHVHHGYRSEITTSKGPIPTLDCGSTGYRAGAMTLLHLEGGQLGPVERYLFDGTSFREEAGGAFNSAR